jgi:hypothetical protein
MTNAKRLNFEIGMLQNNLSLHDNDKTITGFTCLWDSFYISFKGPCNTQYEKDHFTIKFIPSENYPLAQPKIYWVGQSPDHRFYRKDSDDHLTPKRITNLANTNFGIYYQWATPSRTFLDFINRIKYSLTPEGEKEMNDNMQSYP